MTCRRCGAPGTEREIVGSEGAVAEIIACDACTAEADRELAVLREQFDALIDGGFSNEQANAIMIARIEGAEVQ